MSQLHIGCWNDQCEALLLCERQDFDQALYCKSCKQVATFINLGIFICQACSHKTQISLRYNIVSDDVRRCERCNSAALPDSIIRVYSLEQFCKDNGVHPGLNYCGRDGFEGSEAEVPYARAALDRIISSRGGRRLFGLLPPAPKPLMFVRRLEPIKVSDPSVPLGYLQQYHAYCNFKLEPSHQNAKFCGVLGQFATGNVLELLIKKGLVEIWFSDARTKREFEALPRLSKFSSMFRVS